METLIVIAFFALVFIGGIMQLRPVSRHPQHPEPFNSRSAKKPHTASSLSGYARIIDGDSIIIRNKQVRLFGIDAPELNHPYGQKAKWALVRLCKGQKVLATIREVDHHGRIVADCSLEDGTDLSAEMVRQGMAIDWPKFSRGKYRHLEPHGIRKKLWLADARQKGRMHVWQSFEANRRK